MLFKRALPLGLMLVLALGCGKGSEPSSEDKPASSLPGKNASTRTKKPPTEITKKPPKKDPPASSDAEQVARLANQARSAAKLPPLAVSTALNQVAQAEVERLAKAPEFPKTLDSQNLLKRLQASGYPVKTATQGQGIHTAADIQELFNASEMRNIALREGFDDIGIGVARAPGKGQYYYVIILAKPQPPKN